MIRVYAVIHGKLVPEILQPPRHLQRPGLSPLGTVLWFFDSFFPPRKLNDY